MRKWQVLIAVCCSLAAHAQEAEQDEDDEPRKPRDLSYLDEFKLFEGGFTLGFNATQVDGDTYAGYNKAGLHTGGVVLVHFSKTIGVSLELLYSQKGSRGAIEKESYIIGTYFDRYFLNLNYVQMPLVMHVKFHPRIDLEVGAVYGRLVSSWEYAEGDVPWYVDPTKTEFNKTDVCSIFGATYRLSKHWYGDVRYEYSLGSIRPTDRQPVPYTQYGGQYNNSFTFRLVYLL